LLLCYNTSEPLQLPPPFEGFYWITSKYRVVVLRESMMYARTKPEVYVDSLLSDIRYEVLLNR
jgi:hypothetical protein